MNEPQCVKTCDERDERRQERRHERAVIERRDSAEN